MNRLSKIINELESDDLSRIKKDLEEGTLLKAVNQRIAEKKEEDWNKVCPVCHIPIDENALTLTFGPKDLKKKASFCAMDCLEYFIGRLKEQKHLHKTEGLK